MKYKLFTMVIIASLAVFGTYNANATEPKKVEYSTPDGAVLKGTLRGGGNTMVILSHQNRASQKQWTFFAEQLANMGYSTFTYSFRGFGDSPGSIDTTTTVDDLRGTVQYLKNEGSTKFVLISASMGSNATVKVASELKTLANVIMAPYYGGSKFAGAGWDDVKKITSPTFFLTSSFDSSKKHAERMYSQVAGVKKIKVFSGNDHGVKLLTGEHKKECEKLILDFLATHAPVK